MARPYGSALEHVAEELGRVAKIFERRIEADWAAGLLPRIKDQFSGAFVSDGEVRALLAGGLPLDDAARAKIDELDLQIDAAGRCIEERLEATRALGEPLPWDRLRGALALKPTEQLALWVLIAVEVSPRHRQLARYLTNEASRIGADVGLLEACVYRAEGAREHWIDEVGPAGALQRYRLVEVPRHGRELPLLARPLAVVPRVIELVHGRLELDREVLRVAALHPAPSPPPEPSAAPEVVDEVRGLLAAGFAALGRGEPAPALVLAGAEGTGKRTLLGALAAAHGRGLLVVALDTIVDADGELAALGRAIAREAALFGALPVLAGLDLHEQGAAARLKALDGALADLPGPLAATMTSRDARLPHLARGAVRVDLELPTEEARVHLWHHALAGPDGVPLAEEFDLDRVAARYPISGGVIARAASAALALARARGGEVREADVHAGLRGVLDAHMTTLGTRVTRRQRWEDLVLPEDALDGIQEFLARIRHRRVVYEEWGFGRKLQRGLGVSALFAGPPGTGKTMVAGLIADELGLDLYQIDLSRVVSKWIGETEKNLSQLFDAAEAGHAILLFDEADSLFARRTDVKTSVDRYANLEVNYLLQRMERFEGVTILTTNLESSIDAAFKRRLAFRLDFPLPGDEERERLWRAMIPPEALDGDDLDFVELARRYEMSGGNIRNAVLRAAFLAAGRDERITMDTIARAAELEYGAMGKVVAET